MYKTPPLLTEYLNRFLKGEKLILSLALFFLLNSIQAQNKLTAALKKASPYVLKIYTYDSENTKSGQASGVILSKEGVCVTNYHVFSGAQKAEVITTDGSVFNVDYIIDYNKERDLIKFKINPIKALQTATPLTFDNLQQEIGNDVFAVGYPSSFESNNTYTVSTGIISGFRTEENNKYIQSSTPITHGSSGGGLFNYNGQLIGITTGTFAEEVKDRHANLNKVVPAGFINQLKQTKNLTFNQFNQEVFDKDILVQAHYYYNNEDFESAMGLYTDYLRVNTEDPFAWYRVGSCMLRLTLIKDAKNLLTNKEDKQNLYELAAHAFLVSVSLDSTNYYAWSNLCLTQLNLGNRSSAALAIGTAYDLAPSSSKVLGIYGQFYSYNKEYASAIPYFTKAIEMGAYDNSKKNIANMYLERAISNAWLNRDYDANNDYLKSLEYDPEREQTYWGYAHFLGIRKRYSEGCIYAKKLKSINPDYKAQGMHVDELINIVCD